MATPLRLLLAEDTEDDAVLLLRELRRGGYEVACRRVETPEEFSAALSAQNWDLVIADYSLPRFSAPAALAIFKQSRIDIPFIVVSGRVGEETAVAMMKDGAHDYVLKASLVRLPAAMARELDEAQIRREHKQAAEALRAAKEAAEAASRAKSTFLANMSHEIRTPLNAAIGMTELVLKTPLSAQQREFLMTVKDSGEALLSVINDILDFSKIEADKLVLDADTFDLRESLGDTMKSFAIRAHQRGLELTCFIHPDVPRLVVGDYSRLRQVVTNLVGNAIKFTDKGEIDLEVAQDSRSRQDVVLHFTVSDTGIGIAEEKRATIFEMFEQADNTTTRRHGGTGLGLAIAARLVVMMNGRVWLESEVGRGSRFHFTVCLRLGEEEPAERVPPEPACLHEIRVLAVDDNATNRRILGEILRSWRMIPATASGAEEALDLLRRAREAGEPYRLVVTDAHMPRIDGFMLAEQIKRDTLLGGTVIIMLTSGDRPEDMARCNELGIATYLLKPAKQSELLEAIELALGITVPREGLLGPAAQQPHHVPSLHVLLAEDSLVNQKLAVVLLEGQGHTVTLAGNGKEAVAAAGAEQFDLALMDVQMPEMDGMEAAALIRAREKQTGAHLPIIAMTAYALKGDRERCLAAGMDNYVAKPIRAEELFETIDAIFADRPRNPAAGSAVCQDLVDWTEALKVAQGNRKVLKVMAEAALEEVPQLMAAIREALARGDCAKLRFAAHTLKGAVRYFGANQVCGHAAQLEEMGRKDSLAGSETILAALEAEIAQLASALTDYLQAVSADRQARGRP
jgi:signal transduction histidine kinase/two-component SAPR family response regulator